MGGTLLVKILGKMWRLIFLPLSKMPCTNGEPDDGKTDAPTTKGKAIRIATSCRGEKLLEILIHEMLHAANWHLDEEFVAECAEDMARVLWKLGYRCEE